MTMGGHALSLTAELRDRTFSGEWKQLDGDARGTCSAVAFTPAPNEDSSPAVVALYVYERKDGQRIYSTNPDFKERDLDRAAEPLCSVAEPDGKAASRFPRASGPLSTTAWEIVLASGGVSHIPWRSSVDSSRVAKA